MDHKQTLLHHFLAALAYRTQKAGDVFDSPVSSYGKRSTQLSSQAAKSGQLDSMTMSHRPNGEHS